MAIIAKKHPNNGEDKYSNHLGAGDSKIHPYIVIGIMDLLRRDRKEVYPIG